MFVNASHQLAVIGILKSGNMHFQATEMKIEMAPFLFLVPVWALVHGKYRSPESFRETDLHKYAFFFSTLRISIFQMHKYSTVKL